MTRVSQLGYLVLGVRDVAAWTAFATNILGLQALPPSPTGETLLRLDEMDYRIALREDPSDDVLAMGLQFQGEPALAAMADKLATAGVEFSWGTDEEKALRKVRGLIKVNDPNGVTLHLFYGPYCDYRDSFRSPRDISGFLTGSLGLGHVVVFSKDVEASVSFYQDLLGFRVSDWFDGSLKAAFMRCNARHHSVAIFQVEHRRKLQHFMLELQSLDDVGKTYDLVMEREIPLMLSLGRHNVDQMVSFYMNSPAGVAVEYGWGGLHVDEATWQTKTQPSPSIWGHKLLSAGL
jgi:extradiol dioxygenase